MSKHIYQKINWKDYNKFWNENFSKYISEINKYFDNKDKKFKKLNLVFYKSYFYFSISQIIFFNYLHKKKLFQYKENKNFKDTLLNFLGQKSIQYKILKKINLNYQNKLVNFKFFFRHYEFEKKFKKIKNFINIDFNKLTVMRFKKIYLKDYSEFSFDISTELISEIYSLEKNFDYFNKFKYPKILMTSAHAYAHDAISRLFISFSKISNTKIFVYQVNFFQGILNYYNFNKYEEIISDIYFSTGKNLNIKNYIILGSFYSFRAKQKKIKNKKNLVILIQPPELNRNYPYQLSMDWSNSRSEFDANENNSFLNLKEILKKNKNCDFLSKDISYDYYLNKFKKYNIDIKFLKKSYVNSSKRNFNIKYENVFITYPSNAIIEYFYSGSNIYLKFPENFVFFKNVKLKKLFFSSKNFSKFIKTYAKETNPDQVFKIIRNYL